MTFVERERIARDSLKKTMVGMGEIKLAKNDDVLWAVLGSCIGLILYDLTSGIGGVAHIMLPKRENDDSNIGKYADTAIPAMVELMVKNGCEKKQIKARLAGGANMFKWKSKEPNMKIGERNLQAVKEALEAEGIPLVKSAIGGTVGYKVRFCASDGSILIKFIDGRTIELK